MAEPREGDAPEVAKVDVLVDETGATIDVPDDSGIEIARGDAPSVGATGPTNWWLYGIFALAIIVAVLFAMQWLNGAPGTDVQSGTPTAEPVVESPAAPAGQ